MNRRVECKYICGMTECVNCGYRCGCSCRLGSCRGGYYNESVLCDGI